jgi:hypothetical protein
MARGITVDVNLGVFERVCTAELDDHVLFTIESYGKTQYLLYNIPTKTILINQSFRLTPAIIQKMIDLGIRVVDDVAVTHH